jgi:hypothetical protein
LDGAIRFGHKNGDDPENPVVDPPLSFFTLAGVPVFTLFARRM